MLSEAAEGVWEAPQDHGSADAELHPDPFNLNRDSKSAAAILRQRLEAARTSGKLNIAALGLKSIPPEVLGMYDLEAIGRADGSWAESVDLTRLVAADNEIEVLDDDIFPDVDLDDIAAAEEEGRGSIFGGLETLDLHGNLLVTVPMGFRRLQLLTSLNLVCLPSHYICARAFRASDFSARLAGEDARFKVQSSDGSIFEWKGPKRKRRHSSRSMRIPILTFVYRPRIASQTTVWRSLRR